jgi:hypothetical protein
VILSASSETEQPRFNGLTAISVPLGAARTLVGAIVLARPALLASALGIDASAAQRTAWLARMFGGRDVALGIGTLAGSRGCLAAAAAGDAIDAAALIGALRSGHVRRLPAALILLTAGAAAAAGLSAAVVTRR